MDCKKFQMLISAKLDGQLNDAESSKLEKHFQICPACRKDFEKMQKLQEQIDKFSAKAPVFNSEYVWKKMEPTFKQAHNSWKFIPWTLRIAAALIAAFLIFNLWNGNLKLHPDTKMAALEKPLSPEEILSVRLVEGTLIRGGQSNNEIMAQACANNVLNALLQSHVK